MNAEMREQKSKKPFEIIFKGFFTLQEENF